MFTKELMQHIIDYVADYPEDIRLDDYREETRVMVSGRMGSDNNRWGGNRNDFNLCFNYDKKGDLKDVNGMDFTFDTTPLKDAFTKAITRNFKLKKKMTNLKGPAKGKR